MCDENFLHSTISLQSIDFRTISIIYLKKRIQILLKTEYLLNYYGSRVTETGGPEIRGGKITNSSQGH